MSTEALDQIVNKKVETWLSENIDAEAKQEIRRLQNEDPNELFESFYKDLEFGTGGLRGLMGIGTNRINKYTIGTSTQGLCNYLNKEFNTRNQISIAIAHDSRNNSSLFAKTAAKVCAANGIKVYLFDKLRPTPELSFSIRHLGCQAGIVITASHNPKEYNGYKVYFEDGGQIIAPHDKNIIEEVQKIDSLSNVKFEGNDELIEIIGAEIDEAYTEKLVSLCLSPEAIKTNKDLKIVYTPIHGSGVDLVPMTLKKLGFEKVYDVPEQNTPDGNFPTVHSPNPEEPAALNLALIRARSLDADLVMATDPDADRVGIIVKNKEGHYVLLNGNQAASVLIFYLLTKWKENGKLTGSEYIVKTIVTTELIAEIAQSFDVEYFDVLTGFKYIADIIKRNEGRKTFIGGGEESYGYLAGEFVRDKDAVMSCTLFAEIAAWAASNDKTIYDVLLEIYEQFGLYKEMLISVVKQGRKGADEIQDIMKKFREEPPLDLNNVKVVGIYDYQEQKHTNTLNKTVSTIDLPKSNVLQFMLEDGTKISLRPSGTEPKIKLYVSSKGELTSKASFENEAAAVDEKIMKYIDALNIN